MFHIQHFIEIIQRCRWRPILISIQIIFFGLLLSLFWLTLRKLDSIGYFYNN